MIFLKITTVVMFSISQGIYVYTALISAMILLYALQVSKKIFLIRKPSPYFTKTMYTHILKA